MTLAGHLSAFIYKYMHFNVIYLRNDAANQALFPRHNSAAVAMKWWS